MKCIAAEVLTGIRTQYNLTFNQIFSPMNNSLQNIIPLTFVFKFFIDFLREKEKFLPFSQMLAETKAGPEAKSGI